MLNEDRIKVMTKLAIFEKEHGKENEIASKFYKGDYVSYYMVWTGVMTTIAYLLGLVGFFILNFEKYMENMHMMDLWGQAKIIISFYIGIVTAMVMISYFVYRKRYKNAQKRLQKYCDLLHDLEKNYNNERYKEYTNHGRRVDG